MNSLAAPFDASKYRDNYREKLDALIAAKLDGKLFAEVKAPRAAPVVNILDALQRSLDSMVRKPAGSDSPASKPSRSRSQRK